tara:strand:- start:578 stop:1090 length:513 start_codon:yes stop_codon:yes gene_type:complete
MAGSLRYLKEFEATSTVSEILCTDAFSSAYSIYAVYITKTDVTVQTYSYIRLLDSSNNSIGDQEYEYAEQDLGSNGGFSEGKSKTATSWANIDIGGTDDAKNLGHVFYLFNPYDSSKYTYAIGQSAGFTSVGYGSKWIGVHKSREQINGIRYYRGSGNFNNVNVKIFGVQ